MRETRNTPLNTYLRKREITTSVKSKDLKTKKHAR